MDNITPLDSRRDSLKETVLNNPGIELSIEWLRNIRINKSAVERRASTIQTRRSIKKEWQAAWLLKAITFLDLTTLSGDDAPSKVERLCMKGKNPVRQDILEKLNFHERITVGAICVYHSMIETAINSLKNTNIPIAAVSAGFPAGLSPLETRMREIELSLASGAKEIDIVINRSFVLTGNWDALYNEVKMFKKICGKSKLKTIIATGDLSTLRNVARASLVCMMAGSDFIKTSTGKETVNATLPVSLVMVRCIREYYEKTGFKVGFKAAGGISTAKESLAYLTLIKEELGNYWLDQNLFRIGASSLLSDIERQLEHHVSGRYSSYNRHPLS